MSDLDNMFEQIQNSFEKSNKSTGGGIYKDFMFFEKGKDYIVRLLPYAKDPAKTIYKFKYHKWKSKMTDKFVEFLDPTMWDAPNPISQYSRKKWGEMKIAGITENKEDPRVKDVKSLFPKDGFLMNCYVIKDPTNPDNEGEVKILRMGKQLHDIVNEHFLGERKDEFGLRVLDLSAKGCNFKIKVEDNGGGYPKYDKSYFMSASEIEGVSDNKAQIKEIWEKCFDLTSIFPTLDYDQLKAQFESHFLNADGSSTHSSGGKAPSFDDISSLIDENEDEGSDESEKEVVEEEKPKASKPKLEKKEESVDDIDAMLAGLD